MAFLRTFRRRKILLFLAIVGPGIITASVDNDAGGIATYSLNGADYGYGMLWVLFFITIALVVIQEMSARMGVVTGKGLADLIREQFGLRITLLVMFLLLLTNLANTVSEFAGVAASLEIFGISKYLSVPVVAFLIWYLVLKGTYKIVERVFLFASLVYLSYIVSAYLAHPPWGEVLKATISPDFSPLRRGNSAYMLMIIALVGTTIAPWMQFYIQSSIVDKGVRVKEYKYTRWDVILGCAVTDIVAFCIIVACAATLYANGIKIQDAKDAALALRPLAGEYCSLLFAIGLFNASAFSAAILPLSTAYAVCEALGWETGINRNFREAPQFFGLYTAFIVMGAALILIPKAPLLLIMYLSQVMNGLLLPFILVFMLIIINRKEVMGTYTNSKIFNIIAWSTVVILIICSVVLLYTSIF
jgi:Mn2+/Fe2+ NRAMP family transporter